MLGSPVDIALVCGIALIAFGPKKLPELGKSVGLGIANFKAALLLPPTNEDVAKPAAPERVALSEIDRPLPIEEVRAL